VGIGLDSLCRLALSSSNALHYDPIMSKPTEPKSPDLEALAARFLELWQDQLAAMALDPGNVEGWTRLTRLFADGTFPAVLGADHSNAPPKNGKDPDAGPASRPTAPAASLVGIDLRLDEFAKRLADIEKRLGALETKPGPRRRSPSKKSR